MVNQTTGLLAGLNPAQQEAVVTTEGPVLVVAGPGSGKTRVLTHRIAYLIEEQGVIPDRIMAVTFTNKAAREMRTRIESLLGQHAAHGLVMGTFHSLGVRFLRQNPGLVADRLGLLPNFLIYDDADQQSVAKAAISAVGLDPKQVLPRRALSRISGAKSLLLTPDEFANQVENYGDEIIARVYREYERALRKANAVDFDDLLSLPIQLFDAAPTLLERYQEQFHYILVDEYQDTNRVQYVLVTALAAKHRNLFVVGDPDQSIYAWRHADIRNILDFEKDYPDTRMIHLELNYRSTARIVAAADHVIRENTQRIDRKLRTENEDGAQVAVRALADQTHEAQFVVSTVRRLIEHDGVRGDGIAVMYRTTAQSRVLEESFRMSGIPYRIVGGVRFYERKEVKDVLAVLRVLHNPADSLSLERMLENLPLGRGIGPKAIDTIQLWATVNNRTLFDGFLACEPGQTEFSSTPELSGTARSAAQRVGTTLRRLRDERSALTLAALFDRIVDETGYQGQFDQADENEMQRWANVLELRSDLERYDLVDPESALATYLEQIALVADVDLLEDENPTGSVTLITLHSAKGLEFPVVFIVGVEEGLLPISRAVEAEPFDATQIEEERRLFYVGITRAEKLLYITYANFRETYGRGISGVHSRFLLNLPAEHVNGRIRTPGERRSWGLKDRVRAGGSRDDLSFLEPTTASSETLSLPTFEPGQRVFHSKFGEGTIQTAATRAGDQELVIEFRRVGKKTLLASLAKLDVIT